MTLGSYVLPDCWPKKRLEDCLALIRNGTSRRQNKDGSGLPVTRIETISLDRVDPSKVGFVDGLSEKETSRYRLQPGDILFSHINSEPQLGRTAIYRGDPDFLIHGMNLLVLRVNGLLTPEFLHYLCTCYRQSGVFIALAGRAVGQSSINQGKLKALEIPCPPVAEQGKIAAVLSAVHRDIEHQDQLIALTTELRRAAMRMYFTRGTDAASPLDTEIGPIPPKWSTIKIGELGDCVTGTTPKTANREYYEPEERDFIAPADLGSSKYVYSSAKKISQLGLSVARPLPRDAVLCVCIGSSIGKTGMSWHEESCTNQQINAVVCHGSLNPTYVYYLLTYWSERWKSHATFGPVPILNKGAFRQVKIPHTTDRREQDAIADALWTMDARIEHHLSRRAVSTELLRALVHDLMTAKIRVADVDVSPLGPTDVADASPREETA